MAGIQDLIRRYADGGPTVTSQADFQKQWDMLKGQTDPTAVAQRQALSSALGNYQTNQNIKNLFNQGQTSSTNFLNPPPEIYSVNQGQTGSTGFPTNPPPISPLRDMRGGQDNDMLYRPQGTYTSEGTPILTSVTPPPPKIPLVDTRNMLRDDVLYSPQRPYTSEGTPLIVGGANQATSPFASMSSVQQPQGMIQGQAMSPDIQANFPTANTTYDPNKPINEQIKALTSVADRQALLNNYGDYQTNQNIQGLYGLNKANADTFLKYSNADKTGKTTNAFEQALMANPTGANALLQSFNGTGSNPLLGQYNQLSGGTILPYQNGVPTSGMAGTPATNMTSTSASGTPTVKTDAASLKNTYGIDNPALVNYIASTTGLTDSDLKNLKTVYNAKPTQQIAVAQQANDPLHVIANAMVSHDATVKERLTDPKSYIYNQGNVPVYKPASQSTNAVGDIFTTKNSGILNQEIDRNGYLHVTAGGKDYLINPNSNRILGVDPAGTYQPYGSASLGYNDKASGGSVQMPQEYSQGNWKLI